MLDFQHFREIKNVTHKRMSVTKLTNIFTWSKEDHLIWQLINEIFVSRVFEKFSVKTNFLVKSITVKLILRNNSQVIQKFRVQCGKMRNSLSMKKYFVKNQLICNFSKNVNFTNFLLKSVRGISVISTLWFWSLQFNQFFTWIE